MDVQTRKALTSMSVVFFGGLIGIGLFIVIIAAFISPTVGMVLELIWIIFTIIGIKVSESIDSIGRIDMNAFQDVNISMLGMEQVLPLIRLVIS